MTLLFGLTVAVSVAAFLTTARRKQLALGSDDPLEATVCGGTAVVLLVAWARPVPMASVVAAGVLLAAFFLILSRLSKDLPIGTTQGRYPAWWWTTIYSAFVLGSAILVGMILTFTGPDRLGSPAAQAEAVTAGAAIIAVLLPRAARLRTGATIPWALAGLLASILIAAPVPMPSTRPTPELVAAMGMVLGVAASTLPNFGARWVRPDGRDKPTLEASETLSIALRQSGVASVLVLLMIVDWALMAPR